MNTPAARVLYRIAQGLLELFAFARPVDTARAAQLLTPAQMALFRQMRRSEQQHSLNVLRTLERDAPVPADLAAAALLHDVGKTRYAASTLEKTLVVLTKAFAPRLYARWKEGGAWWQRAYAVHAHHPAWGADLLAQAGASEGALWLVAQHAAPESAWAAHPDAPQMRRLRAADDAN